MKKRDLRKRVGQLEELAYTRYRENQRLTSKLNNIQAYLDTQRLAWRQKDEFMDGLWRRISACRHNRGIRRFREEWEKMR